MEKMVTIGQLSLETGVSPRAIRLYESGGLLGVVARRENGYRVYSQQNIKLLCLIKEGVPDGVEFRPVTSR